MIPTEEETTIETNHNQKCRHPTLTTIARSGVIFSTSFKPLHPCDKERKRAKHNRNRETWGRKTRLPNRSRMSALTLKNRKTGERDKYIWLIVTRKLYNVKIQYATCRPQKSFSSRACMHSEWIVHVSFALALSLSLSRCVYVSCPP